MKLIRSTAVCIAACLALTCAAQGLEIIALRHRTVEQVLPVLRPLLEPGGTLTGQGTQLIVRTSPQNLAELRRALDALDSPARRLQVLVRFAGSGEASRQAVQGSARIGGRESRIEFGAAGAERRSVERVDQSIQVLEGSPAYISTGSSRPVMGGLALQDTGTGFSVIPRVSGSTVLLELVQGRSTPGPRGSAQSSGLSSTVAARLGEWVEVGSTMQQSSGDQRGLASASASRGASTQSVWLKVEELRN